MQDEKLNKGSPHSPSPAIRLRKISKHFGSVRANRAIDLEIQAGTIHGIVGENGAGKSTLMNIIYGLHTADSGAIEVFGKPTAINTSADAIRLGIGMVHQHFMLIPNMSVLDNIMLGSEDGYLLKEGRAKTLQTLQKLSDEYGMDDALVEDLPVGVRQRVEIIKAIRSGAKILILDEPTGVLTPSEVRRLFEILISLRDDGVTILLITHKLEEIMKITDHVSVMRDGEMIDHVETRETTPGKLAKMMVGREVLLRVDCGEAHPGDILLRAERVGCISKGRRALLTDISFDLRAGEILGVAGVAGSGQTELLELLTGMRKPNTGRLQILDEMISPQDGKNPSDLRSMGVGHIPEDRHRHGLVLSFTASENAILGYQQNTEYRNGVMLDRGAIDAYCTNLMVAHDVRPNDLSLAANSFSGGNQQKLVIGREVDKQPKILVVGQPTRGVDIGAIEFIHKQLIELRDQGCAILLVSVELEEILGLSNRIMVMNNGRIVGLIDRTDASEESIGLMMAGISKETAA